MKLSKSFYQQDTIKVAKALLGKKLVRVINGIRLSGIITEVEAYLGAKDKACHTYNYRRTKRVEPMYSQGGISYVYFVYGMHYCFNVVTRKRDEPEAVLIRSIIPIEGISKMKQLRGGLSEKNLTNGPGKLCKALGITVRENALSLCGDKIFIEKFKTISPSQILSSPRIGVDYAGKDAKKLLRFYLQV
ncbi:MAG: DNA-3-methyladenine glycosylase [Oligoflexia bacterium]|nr:DNA-3-methyladenine glycosylase [Oligoflexia bacterium]